MLVNFQLVIQLSPSCIYLFIHSTSIDPPAQAPRGKQEEKSQKRRRLYIPSPTEIKQNFSRLTHNGNPPRWRALFISTDSMFCHRLSKIASQSSWKQEIATMVNALEASQRKWVYASPW